MSKEVDKMQLPGKERQLALERFARQLEEWCLAMPPVEPLIMDFGQGNFYRVGLIEYWIANEIEAGYCGKYLFLFDGQQCPFHSHNEKHETFFVVKGKVRMTVDEKEQVMNEGDVLVMPAGRVHSFTGSGNALILEISTPCLVSDNDFQDIKIANWLNKNVRSF